MQATRRSKYCGIVAVLRRPLIAAAGAGGRGLRVELRDFGGAAAAGREPAADFRQRVQDAAAVVDGRLAVGEEGLPRYALRVGDPLLVRLRVAADRRPLLDHRALGAGEPIVDLGQFAFVLGLDAEMRDARTMASAGADREIDYLVIESPIRVIRLRNRL